MVSAQRGEGKAAHWVWTCSCPLGYEGDLCHRCSAGFKRTNPVDGPFSSCEPCGCRGGTCDSHTGDCYSADETPGDLNCPRGFYWNRRYSDTCLKCPCPDGVSCTVKDGSVQPHCDNCPLGSAGKTFSLSLMSFSSTANDRIHNWSQVPSVTSVRRVSMVILWEAAVCREPADPVNAMVTSVSAFQEVVIAAVVNVSSVPTTRGGGAVSHVCQISTTAEHLIPAQVTYPLFF